MNRGELLARGVDMLDDLRHLRKSHYERLEDSLEGSAREEYQKMKTDIIAKNKETWRRTRYLPPLIKDIVRGAIKNRRSTPLIEYLEREATR
jgi:hypothetical protein